ncbi:MAG: phage holin family protein [Flavobacteriales bacterium]|nr:phage holin family protein [Flavobacteriales bacterium]
MPPQQGRTEGISGNTHPHRRRTGAHARNELVNGRWIADELCMQHDTESSNGTPSHASATAEGGHLDFSSFMDGLVGDMQGYAKAQRRYLTLHATEKASTLMGKAVEHTAIVVVLGMALLFLNVALAFYLGDLLASRPLGFVLVAGIYLLLLGAFLLWWKNGARDRFVLDRINDLNDDN